MTPAEILRLRLLQQRISQSPFNRPEEPVGWMGAMQAQDYAAAKWAIGLRMREGTAAKIDHAIARKTIVRSWLFRGTLHFATAKDYHWMRELVAERLIAGSAGRRADLELDERTLSRSRKIFIKALQGAEEVRRDELMASLKKAGISPDNQRGYHLLWRCAMDGLICFGSHQDKQPAFALTEEWLPKAGPRAREESLAILAERYFKSRGPATLKDFIWWSGLKVSEAKAGLGAVAGQLRQETADGSVYWMDAESTPLKADPLQGFLLPGFDEYLLGYTDRKAAITAEHFQKIVPGNNGMFLPMMVRRGRIVGTWKHRAMKNRVVLTPLFFEEVGKGRGAAWKTPLLAYGKFLGMPAEFLNM